MIVSAFGPKAARVAGRVNHPGSVDVVYAHGHLTSTGGHGFEVYESLALRIPPDAATMAQQRTRILASRRADGDGYYLIDSLADLERQWAAILAARPGILKVHLVESDLHARRVRGRDTLRLGSIGGIASAPWCTSAV